MKYIFISLFAIAVLFRFDGAKAQYVTIPDPMFVEWLQNNGYATCLIGDQLDTTCSAVVTDTSLMCGLYSITDVYGVQFFDNLLSLGCGGNMLTSLPRLPNTLKYLGCDFNEIDSLPLLPPGLTNLYADGNNLVSVPALPSTLRLLGLGGNQLGELPPLPAGLIFLNIQDNQFFELPQLPDSLEALVCDGNQITALPTQVPSTLQYLQCGHNPLTDLPILPDSVWYLECSFCQLTDLPTLPTYLETLFCRHNQITELPALPNGLRALECGQNPLGSLPSLPASLIELYCYENALTGLPTLPSKLKYFDCGNNLIAELPPLPDTLKHLSVAGNVDLTCLPPLQVLSGYSSANFDISGTNIECLPNAIQHPLMASLPVIDTMPICLPNDPCAIVTCDAPNNLTLDNPTSSLPSAIWNTEDIAVKYRVRVKNITTGQTFLQIVNAPDTTKALTGLSANTVYKVQVRSQCSTSGSVLSPWSSPIYFTTPGTSTCIAPTNVSATPASNTSENISWTPVAGAAGYQLRYKVNGTATWTPIVINNGATSYQTLNALTPNTTYDYQLRTKCSTGPLVWSNYTAVQTFTTPLRIGEEGIVAKVQLYPNPSNGTVTFNSNGLVGTLSIYDAVGGIIFHQAVSTTQTGLTHLPTGLLVYKFMDATGKAYIDKFTVTR